MPSRKPHLSIATAVGEANFDISSAHWSHIEKAYGRLLSKTVRRPIIIVTNQFLEFESYERSAEMLSATKEKIERVYRAAGEFKSVLGGATGDDAFLEARYSIAENFQYAGLAGQPALRKFEDTLIDVQIGFQQIRSGCNQSLKEIDENKGPGFRGGDSWSQWVQALTKTAKKFRLPDGVSKGGDKSRSAADASPFVHLIYELQKYLPAECRRHTHSLGALSQAIQRARGGGTRMRAEIN